MTGWRRELAKLVSSSEIDFSISSRVASSPSSKLPRQLAISLRMNEMISGYRELHYRLLENRGIADRIINKNKYLTNPIYRSRFGLKDNLIAMGKFISRGLLPGGASRLYHFSRTIPWTNLKLLPMVIQDWVTGLAMRDYVDRNFIEEFEEAEQLDAEFESSGFVGSLPYRRD